MNLIELVMAIVIATVVVASLLVFIAHAICALVWRRKLAFVPRDVHVRHREDIEGRQIRAQAYAALFLAIFVTMAVLLFATTISYRHATTEIQSFVLMVPPVLTAATIGYMAVKHYDARCCCSYLRSTYFPDA